MPRAGRGDPRESLAPASPKRVPPFRGSVGEVRDRFALVGKSILVILGGILVSAAAVDLIVAGWSLRAAGTLGVGLLFAGVPLGLAFRDAVRAGRGPPDGS